MGVREAKADSLYRLPRAAVTMVSTVCGWDYPRYVERAWFMS